MMRSTLSRLPLLLALAATPMIVLPVHAQDHKEEKAERRVYDSVHKDYHAWNADEDRRYREYLEEHHRAYKDYSRLSKKDQRAYWNWRHDHDDHR